MQKNRRKFTCRGDFAAPDIRRLAAIERSAAYAAYSCFAAGTRDAWLNHYSHSHAAGMQKNRRKFTCRGDFAAPDIRRLAAIERSAAYAAYSCFAAGTRDAWLNHYSHSHAAGDAKKPAKKFQEVHT